MAKFKRRRVLVYAVPAAVIALVALGGAAYRAASNAASLVPTAVPAPQTFDAANSTSGYYDICQDNSPSYCIRDPNDWGNDGITALVNNGPSSAKSHLWAMYYDSSRCNNGRVSNSRACPFRPGSGMNTKYDGDPVIIIRNPNGYCIGSPTGNNPFRSLYMRDCDGINGAHEPSTVFVLHGHQLVSLVWTDYWGSTYLIDGRTSQNGLLYVGIPRDVGYWF